MKKIKNKNATLQTDKNGITLIALVITIIVLLILAGAAVSIGLNSGDLFGKANNAVTGWNTKVNEENEKIGEVWNMLNAVTNGNGGGGSGSPTLPAGWNEDSLAENGVYSDGTTDTRVAPIPAGFKVSIYDGETTIADGLVIYETTTALVADEEGSTTNHDSAMTTYNQYVWIPVADINNMIMCDSHSETSDCDIVIDEETGKIYCKNHMTVSDAEKTDTDTKFLCGRLYGGGTSFGTQSPTTYTYNSGYREPAVVTGKSSASSLTDYLTGTNYDGASSSSILKEDGTTSVTGASNILEELKRQFNAMVKSVATYGGFYVGRYEAGYVDSVCTSKKAVPVANILNAGSNSTSNPGGVGNWYGLYNKIIQRKTGTVSQMIWGCQWDQVMKFVDGKKDNNGTGDTYSVTQAKTTEGTTRHTGSKAVTGANINDLVQNIYDLEGNFTEWTSIANYTFSRAFRGGLYNNSLTASYLDSLPPTSTSDYKSARSGLYVSL